MKTEILVYGLRASSTERYQEELLATNCRTAAHIEAVKAAAAAEGFHSFRVATYDGSAPNFAACINV